MTWLLAPRVAIGPALAIPGSLAVLALALRLWLIGSAGVIETDGVRYVAIARELQASGSPLDGLYHPLYPLAIGIVQPLVGDHERAGRLVSAVSGALVIAPAFALVRGVLGAEAAAVSAALVAVHPALVAGSTAVLSEALYTLLLVLGACWGWKGLTGPPARLPVAGLLFGLAYLVRPEGALYAAGVVTLGLLRAARAARRTSATAWSLASVLAFLLPAAPYLLYLRSTLGYWTLTGKIQHNLAQDLGLVRAAGQNDLTLLATAWVAVAQRVGENAFLFQKYALPDLFPGILLLFVLPGVLAVWRDGGRSKLLLAALALPPFATLVFHVESRVFAPALPFLLPFVALGIVATATCLTGPPAPWRPVAAVVALVVLSLAPYTLRPIVRHDPAKVAYRAVATWIAATQEPDAVVMDRKPFVAFYSGRRFVPLPAVTADGLAAAARAAGARLVILDSRVLRDRATLIPSVYGAAPRGLRVVHERDIEPGEHLRVLLVLGGD